MSYILAILCFILSIYDRMTGNVLDCGQMMVACACFAIAGNLGALVNIFNKNKEKENEENG